MKKILIKFLPLLLIIFSLIGAKPLECDPLSTKSFWGLDSDSTKDLPDRYRDEKSLNISGSAQFTKDQIPNLKEKINKSNICIIDLRQESHGLINDLAISYYNIYETPNNGLSTSEVLKKEKKDLSKIKENSKENIYHKTGRLYKTIDVNYVSTEEAAVIESGMQYKRFAVVDNGIPTPSVVDDFVEFILNKPDDLHLHFHCDAGEGRTTTFMALYQIMNSSNLSLEQILSYQYNIGGIILTDNKVRLEFLEEFYNYVSKNKNSNYEIKYSQWLCDY